MAALGPWRRRPPLAALALVAVAMRSAGVIAHAKDLRCEETEPGVCHVKESAETSWFTGEFRLWFDGDIYIDEGVRLATYWQAADIMILATGKLTVMERVEIKSGADIHLWAKSYVIHNHVSLTADVKVTFGDEDDNQECEKVSIIGDEVNIFAGGDMVMDCPKGLVEITGRGTKIELGEIRPEDPVVFYCRCNSAHLGSGVSLDAKFINIEAATDLFLSARMPPKKSDQALETKEVQLNLKAGDWLHMGARESEWRVHRLKAAASYITLQTGHVIKKSSGTPNLENTKRATNADICLGVMKKAKGPLDEFSTYVAQKLPLKFEVVIVASATFNMLPSSRVMGASLLICSGDQGTLDNGALLSAECRGHGPGKGCCTGETLQDCGAAGGASGFGDGGNGAKFTTQSVDPCAKTSSSKVAPFSMAKENSLPTETASGGGCGTPADVCGQLRQDSQRPSAGGGLIWLSIRHLETQEKVKVVADGCGGKIVTHMNKDYISGGGAGGAIIMFVATLATGPGGLQLSAEGGEARCNQAAELVSGGGAGGFVGIRWADMPGSSKKLKVLVAGGKMNDAECDRHVPKEQSQRDLIYGNNGIAATLAECPSGYVGPFCEPCEVGKFAATAYDTRMNLCHDCDNKPNLRALYTKEAHDNRDCPYECVEGIAPAAENPTCACPSGRVGESCEQCRIGTWADAESEECIPCANKPHRSEYTTAGWHSSKCPFRCNMEVHGPNCECPAGYGTAECIACPVGTWSEFGSDQCVACENKPSRWSEYTDMAWTTEECSYRCLPGMPNVTVNPTCDCPKGHAGPLCKRCKVGTWSDMNSMECHPCRNRPGYSEYVMAGWPNASCPYRCTSDAIYLSDEKCRGAMQYIADLLFGGESTFGTLALVAIFLLGTIVGCLSRSSARRARLRDRKYRFVHDKLPYHICRVHLCGQNRLHSTWKLSKQVPAPLEGLIAEELYRGFIEELHRKTKVKRLEGMIERMLMFTHPPLAPFFVLWRRRHRGRAMKDLVRTHSDGRTNKAAVWRALPGMQQRRSLQMIFTCDASATSGYIDFFDLSQELFDWKPVDLRKEARLLIAHGLGNYADPFALDVGDPLVEQLAQTAFGAPAIYSMVFTFNRLARLVPGYEMDLNVESRPCMERLQEGVANRASQCGLEGVVKVCFLPQLPPRDFEKEPLDLGHPGLEASFSDLVDQRYAGSGQGSPGGVGEFHGDGAGGSRDVRLCLVFADQRGAGSLYGEEIGLDRQGSTASTTSSSTAAQSGSMTRIPTRRRYRMAPGFASPRGMMSPVGEIDESPLTLPMTHDIMESVVMDPPPSRNPAKKPTLAYLLQACQSALCGVQERITIRFAQVIDDTDQPRCSVRALAFLSALGLWFLDSVMTVLVAQVLSLRSWWYVPLWLLAPPLTPILATVSGLMFLFWEHWRLGRFHASMVGWSGVNLFVASCLLTLHHSIEQLVTWFPLLVSCKLTLFCCVNVRVMDIEARRDQRRSFTKTDAASFINSDNVDWRASLKKWSHRLPWSWAWIGPPHLQQSDDADAIEVIEMNDIRRGRSRNSVDEGSDSSQSWIAQASPF